jgi:hypothetical protein
MYVVGTSFTYPKPSKEAKKFCNVWSLLFVTFKTMAIRPCFSGKMYVEMLCGCF